MADSVSAPHPFQHLHGADSARLTRWWNSLDDNRGERARLRRADSPDDILLTDAFFHFLHEMPDNWAQTQRLYASALVASTLVHVKNDVRGKSFAAQLGTGDKPAMSELRFRQLLKSRTPEEFFRRLLRAIRLLKGNVNLPSLTDGILHWYDEYLHGPERNPVNRLSVKWAQDYYLSPKKDPA